MNDSALDILAGTFKKQETLTDNNIYTFESKITTLDKNIGAGCPVHVFEKATGTLVYTTETDNESFIYVPNLFKNIKYFVVATDKNDVYNSVIFDLNWDFAEQSENKYNLKYYNKYQPKDYKNSYEYTDIVSDLTYDQSLLYSLSVPLQKEDQGSTWFGTGTFNVENIDGFPSFSFKGVSSAYTYINFTPVQTGEPFTIECYIRPLMLLSGKTVAGGIFSQGTSQGLFISDDFRLSYKNKTTTISTISTLESDAWYHLALTYDSQNLRLFLNGKKEAEVADEIGLEYLSTVFCVGAGFYGYLSGFKMFLESKYDEDFTPSFKPFGHLPVTYIDEEDPYANQTVLKTYINEKGFLKDKARNTPLSFDYTIPKNSYVVSNNSFIRTPTQYVDLALNGDFTIECKFRLLNIVGTNPVLFGNKSTKTEWTNNSWHFHADHPNQAMKYGVSIYGGNYNNAVANYPVIYNEPVSLVLQRRGTTYSYYFNGFADKSFVYAPAIDNKSTSYFCIGGDTNFELYDIKITKGVARYSEDFADELLQGSSDLLDSYYRIANYNFKDNLYDPRNALVFVNVGLYLTNERSSYNTKSARFFNNYLVTTNSYWYTPSEAFTVEFKISCNTLPLSEEDTVNTATLFSIFTSTSDNFKLAIRDKYLSFYNGTEWVDSEFELDTETNFKHIVLQRNSTSIKVLAEGSLVLETTCPDLTGKRNVSIGSNKEGSDNFNGYMNNLYIYKNYCKYPDQYEVPEDPDEHVPEEEEKEPEVVVTPYTTSALDFENGSIVDQVPTTVWVKEGTADITTTNTIFGNSSFETKALGDSLYTTSNIITGGRTPFTIEFYALVKNSVSVSNFFNGYALLSQNRGGGDSDQQLLVQNKKAYLYRGSNGGSNPFAVQRGYKTLDYNEINKYTLTYDGAALRLFVNDALDIVVGSNTGWDVTNPNPFKFFDNIVSGYTQYRVGCIGILDNINIHDGIATTVRNYDMYEDNLIVDLPFDGENNSTTVVDNCSKPYSHMVTLYYPFTKSSYDGSVSGTITIQDGTSVYGDKCAYFNSSYITHPSSDNFNLSNKDFTIKVWVKFDSSYSSSQLYPSIIAKRYSGTDWDWGIEANMNNKDINFVYNRQQYVTIGSVVLNEWMHICVTCKNGVLRTFKNGKLTSTSNLTGVIAHSSASVLVGRTSTSWSDNYYKGHMKDLVLINGFCEHTEPFELPSTPEIINKWIVTGSAKLSTTQPFDGFSSLHTGSTGYVANYQEHSLDLKTEDFTISFEVLFTSIVSNGWNTFLANNTTNEANYHQFGYSTHNGSYSVYVNLYLSNQQYANISCNYVFEINKRYKIDLIRRSDNLLLCINDVVIGTNAIVRPNVNVNFGVDGGVLIGTCGWGINSAHHRGYIKNFKVYKGVAVIPESPNGKIQLDFDNNVSDKYGNSTWTNTGVTFDQVNSAKGYATYFASSNQRITSGQNSNFDFEKNNFYIKLDAKALANRGTYAEIFSSGQTTWQNGCTTVRWFNDGTMRLATYYNQVDTNVGGINLPNDSYYNINFSKINLNMFTIVNDVLVDTYNLDPNMTFNFNANNNTCIGHAIWSGSDGGFKGYIDNFKSYKEDLLTDLVIYNTNSTFIYNVTNEVLELRYPTVINNPVPYYTVVIDDGPILSNFIFECETFLEKNGNSQFRIAFRTNDYSLNEDMKFGFVAYIVEKFVRIGRGSNSNTGSWNNEQTVNIPQFFDDAYHTFKVIANGSLISIYVDDQLILDYTDSTYNSVSSTLAVHGNGGFTYRPCFIKNMRVSDLDSNEIYYKDFKSKIENPINHTAVHLPLETNADSIGFANITVNSIGNPTYHVLGNKKCIKFEQGKFLNIASNNIFNLGSSADFYIEFDFYVISHKNYNFLLCNDTVYTNQLLCIIFLNNKGELKVRLINDNDIYTSVPLNLNEFYNFKMYRRNSTIYLSLNDNVTTLPNFNYNMSINAFIIGRSGWNGAADFLNGYMSNFKMFVGTSEIPESYNQHKVLDLDFKPTGKSYLFKDNNNKCIVHPVNITQRDYQDSQYCCSFNGTNQYLQLGKNELLNFGKDDFIIDIKFYFNLSNNNNTEAALLASGNTSWSSGSIYFVIGGQGTTLNKICFGMYGISDILASTNTINDGYNKVTLLKENGTIKLIVNDVITTSTYTNLNNATINLNSNSNTLIGRPLWSTNEFFKGSIYSIKVFRNTSDLGLLEDV